MSDEGKVRKLQHRIGDLERANAQIETMFADEFRAHRGHCLLPPAELRLHVGTKTTPQNFWAQGLASSRRVIATFGLEPSGLVLDWGCGSGRTLNWLIGQGTWNTQWRGCDVDPEAIAWLNAEGYANAVACSDDPPLPYPDDHFVGLYAFSVLTHIHPDKHRAWYEEIRRVLKPGGRAFLTVQGDAIVDGGRVRDQAMVERYRAHGWCYVEHEGHYKNAALVSAEFTKALAGQTLAIEDYKGTGYQNMDCFVVRKA